MNCRLAPFVVFFNLYRIWIKLVLSWRMVLFRHQLYFLAPPNLSFFSDSNCARLFLRLLFFYLLDHLNTEDIIITNAGPIEKRNMPDIHEMAEFTASLLSIQIKNRSKKREV